MLLQKGTSVLIWELIGLFIISALCWLVCINTSVHGSHTRNITLPLQEKKRQFEKKSLMTKQCKMMTSCHLFILFFWRWKAFMGLNCWRCIFQARLRQMCIFQLLPTFMSHTNVHAQVIVCDFRFVNDTVADYHTVCPRSPAVPGNGGVCACVCVCSQRLRGRGHIWTWLSEQRLKLSERAAERGGYGLEGVVHCNGR